MRQDKLEIKDDAVVAQILQSAKVGRLGTNGADGFPYITPVNFVFWNESIYFHGATKGEKLDNLVRDPKVCFAIDLPLAYLDTKFAKEAPTCSVTQFYQSVIIRGKAELVDDIDEKVQALNVLMKSHEKDGEFTEITSQTKAVSVTSVVAIRIQSLTAKANLAQKKSSEHKETICKYLTARNLPGDLQTADLLKDLS